MFRVNNVSLTAVTLNFGIDGYFGQYRPRPEELAKCMVTIVTKQIEKNPLLWTLLMFVSFNVSTFYVTGTEHKSALLGYWKK